MQTFISLGLVKMVIKFKQEKNKFFETSPAELNPDEVLSFILIKD